MVAENMSDLSPPHPRNGRILVSGATGKIGGEVCNLLSHRSGQLRLLVRDEAKAGRFRERGFEVAQTSFEDQQGLERAFEGVDTLLLVPPDADVGVADSAIDAAVHADVRRVVRISALGALDNSPSALLRAHAAGERKLESSGLAYRHLRCNTFHQNVDLFADWIDRFDAIFTCNGRQPIAWIDARDIAAAAVGILLSNDSRSGAHDLNGPEALNFFDVADLISTHIGRPIACHSYGPEEFVEVVTRLGWPAQIAQEWAAMFSDDYWGAGLGGGSDSDLRSLIGQEPRRLSEYLRDHELAAKRASSSHLEERMGAGE